ncbi:MAG: LCP family protein [Bacillota bacterium]
MSKRKKIIKALYITIAVLIVAACGFGVIAFTKAKAAWDNPGGTLEAGADAYGYKESVVNLVLIGDDSNTARERQNIGVRTDTIVICAIDMEKNTARCITIPRDTYVTINKINSSGEIIGEGVNRINAAYMLGIHGNAGYNYQNTLDALGDLFGNQKIPFKYYAAVNMDGISAIADAVGGVSVTLDATIPDVGQKGETVLLTGKTAEEYVRTRKGAALNGSDLSRAQRQQAFFMGLAKKIKEMGPMDAVPRLWGSLQKYFETNMNLEDMLAFASILNKMDTDSIEFTMPVGTTGMLDGKSLFFPDEEELQKLALDTWFNLPPGTVLWTASPRKTPSKIIATPTYSSYTMPPTAKPTETPTATATPEDTQEPTATVKPTATAPPKTTAPPSTTAPPATTAPPSTTAPPATTAPPTATAPPASP